MHTLFAMDSKKIVLKAEAWKIKSHRLSLSLRLKSTADAKRFIREHAAVLWSEKAEIPNLLDAIIGRIASENERHNSRAAESCRIWRQELLTDPELLECAFFRKRNTVMHQDLWPYLTHFASRNRNRIDEEPLLSKDAKRIYNFLAREGATPAGDMRKGMHSAGLGDARAFRKAEEELQNLLLIAVRKEPQAGKETSIIIFDLWENSMSKTVRARADQLTERESRLKLLAVALNGSVLTREKDIRRWFNWCSVDCLEALETLVQNKTFVRVKQGKDVWIVPRKILSK
jgi:hypothetical protein